MTKFLEVEIFTKHQESSSDWKQVWSTIGNIRSLVYEYKMYKDNEEALPLVEHVNMCQV